MYNYVFSKFYVPLFLFRVSERQIIVYKREDLSNPIATVGLDVSPAILIPFYDEDSSTLFLTGKVKQSLLFLPKVDSPIIWDVH